MGARRAAGGGRRWRWSAVLVALVVTGVLAGAASVGASPVLTSPLVADAGGHTNDAALANINGTGSTYVGLAMQQWTAEGQTQGLNVNYTPTGSPDGLSRYAGGQVDFAGTEAEFSSLQQGGDPGRGFQYVPDVAGAVAVMYNIKDVSGRKVDYLHLSRSTIAKIFLGVISNWNDPQIAADNQPANLKLADQPINVVYRSGQSGTTALFYDFVREIEPNLFAQWAQRNNLPTNVRIIQLDSSPSFAPKTQALSGSDQIAQYVASDAGNGSVAYDEFGYAKVYRAAAAWVQNESGHWVLPYAVNISAALDSATLRPDLSQELSGVYHSPNPKAYPVSAYSYVVTQCASASDRSTCKGNYANAGVAGTLTKWLRYVACDGQARMAQIGYSPLPPSLSQEVANSVGRMNGAGAEQLNAGNCPNPRFSGGLGVGAESPADPYLNLPGFNDGGGSGGGAANGAAAGAAGAGAGAGGNGNGTGQGDAAGADGAAGAADGGGSSGDTVPGGNGGVKAIGGGSTSWKAALPVVYPQAPDPASAWPVMALLLALVVPVAGVSIGRRRQRPGPAPSGEPPP